jgi:hypothetical protein
VGEAWWGLGEGVLERCGRGLSAGVDAALCSLCCAGWWQWQLWGAVLCGGTLVVGRCHKLRAGGVPRRRWRRWCRCWQQSFMCGSS